MCKDYFGQEASLQNKRLWLFDMDGTIYEDDVLYDGRRVGASAVDYGARRKLCLYNKQFVKASGRLHKKVNRLGIDVTEKYFFTSSQATILWLQKNMRGAVVCCQGEKA